MRVLLVTAMYPPIQTGTSFYSKNLASALAARGHEVTVFTLRNEEREGPDEDVPFRVVRVPAVHFPVRNYFKHFRIASFFPGNFAAVLREARSVRPDVVLLVNHYLDIAFLAVAAARELGVPMVTSVGTQLQSADPTRDRVLNVLDRLICGQAVFRFSDVIVSWDAEIHRYLSEIHGPAVAAKSVIVPYGVNGDLDVFRRHTHAPAYKGQLLGVGAVIEQRSFVPVVEIFRRLAPRFPTLRLKIIGHVYHDEAVRRVQALGLQDRVSFLGEQPHDVVMEEYARSDVHTIPTTGRYQGLGTAALESMLMGVPTLVNAPDDFFGPDTLRSGENFLFADGRDPDGEAERLARVLEDESLRARIGNAGRAFAFDHMSWEKVAEGMETALAGAVSKGRGTGRGGP